MPKSQELVCPKPASKNRISGAADCVKKPYLRCHRMRKKTGSQVRHRRWGRGRQLDGNCSLQLSSLETTSAELSSPGATPAVAKRKNVCSSNLYGQMYISLEETHKTKLFPISLHRTEPQRALGLDPNVWPRKTKKNTGGRGGWERSAAKPRKWGRHRTTT